VSVDFDFDFDADLDFDFAFNDDACCFTRRTSVIGEEAVPATPR
jgi:hypothetical protein